MPELDKMRREKIQKAPVEMKAAIEFVYDAPHAKKVYLAGSFNNWDAGALPMKKNKHGQWKTTVMLVPGRHEYKFVADGSWITDPRCREVAVNDLGSTNCVISVAPSIAA
jgi:1,4-alpha-glucan branching enzyme